MTDTSTLVFDNCSFGAAVSPISSSASAGSVVILESFFGIPLATSGTASCANQYSTYATETFNLTCYNCDGSGGSGFIHCYLLSGTASAITSTQFTQVSMCRIVSSNINAIAVVGELFLGGFLRHVLVLFHGGEFPSVCGVIAPANDPTPYAFRTKLQRPGADP